MKKFGSFTEQETTVFRTSGDSKVLTLTPPSSLTGASLTLTLPDVSGTADTLISATSTATLTNKTIDGDDNTIQDLSLSTLKDNAPAASTFLQRNGSGEAVDNLKSVPTGDVVGTSDTQTLSAKTLTSPVINTSVSGTALETDLGVSAASNKLPTAAAAKAYADSVGGGSGGTYVQKSANYTITDSDNHRVIGVDASSGAVTITLPTVADNSSRLITIKKEDSTTNAVTVDGEGAETIDGATTQLLNFENDSISIISTGTVWETVDKRRVSDGTGVAPLGELGHIISSGSVSVTGMGSNAIVNVTSISLTRGTWLINAGFSVERSTGTPIEVADSIQYGVGTVASPGGIGTTTNVDKIIHHISGGPSSENWFVDGLTGLPRVVFCKNVSTTTTMYLNGLIGFVAGAPRFYGYIDAIRIF